MLDTSYCKGRIVTPYAEAVSGWDKLPMQDRIDINAIRAQLQRIMSRKDVKPTTLSLRVGTSKTLVKDLMEKTDDVKLGTLQKLADALEVDLSELLQKPFVPIGGYIGAGGHVIFEDFGESFEPDILVPRPPHISGSLIALMVRGVSMLPRYRDGDIIYIQRKHDGVDEADIGEDCAVRLESGETFIKQLTKGSTPGRFTLLSLNAEPIVDEKIIWATPVLFVMPRRARLLME